MNATQEKTQVTPILFSLTIIMTGVFYVTAVFADAFPQTKWIEKAVMWTCYTWMVTFMICVADWSIRWLLQPETKSPKRRIHYFVEWTLIGAYLWFLFASGIGDIIHFLPFYKQVICTLSICLLFMCCLFITDGICDWLCNRHDQQRQFIDIVDLAWVKQAEQRAKEQPRLVPDDLLMTDQKHRINRGSQ